MQRCSSWFVRVVSYWTVLRCVPASTATIPPGTRDLDMLAAVGVAQRAPRLTPSDAADLTRTISGSAVSDVPISVYTQNAARGWCAWACASRLAAHLCVGLCEDSCSGAHTGERVYCACRRTGHDRQWWREPLRE